MRVYVAARDFERARTVMDALRAEGHVISLDWTKYPPGTRAPLPAMEMREGVRYSDVLVLVGWDKRMLGALLEVGMALAHGIPVRLLDYGGAARDSLFWCLPEVERRTLSELLEEIGA